MEVSRPNLLKLTETQLSGADWSPQSPRRFVENQAEKHPGLLHSLQRFRLYALSLPVTQAAENLLVLGAVTACPRLLSAQHLPGGELSS